jgi:hypothetical protein
MHRRRSIQFLSLGFPHPQRAERDAAIGAHGFVQNARIMRFVQRRSSMNLHLVVGPVAALIAGILILLMPQLLSYIVAIYLIIVGVLGLMNKGTFSSKVP